jgi:hypothetical protein
MVEMSCSNGAIQELSMPTKIKEPIYISGVPTYDLYLQKYANQRYLYINGIRAKVLLGGTHYQMIEPVLLSHFDEICRLFNENTVKLVVDDESYLPFIIQADGWPIFSIEITGTTFVMNTKLGLYNIIDTSKRIELIFNFEIIPLLKEVGLYD